MTTEELKAHFLSEAFVDHNTSGAGCRGKSEPDRDAVAERAEAKAEEMSMRADAKKQETIVGKQLTEAWMNKLREVCVTQDLNFAETKQIFQGGQGNCCVHFPLQREWDHREETKRKRNTGSIADDDPEVPLLCNFMRADGTEVPIADFVCSAEVCWSRHSGVDKTLTQDETELGGGSCKTTTQDLMKKGITLGKAGERVRRVHQGSGSSAYTTKARNGPEQMRVVYGRLRSTRGEKDAYSRALAAAVKNGTEHPTHPIMISKRWEPIPLDLMMKLKDVLPLFFKCQEQKSGARKKANDSHLTLERSALESIGERHVHKASGPRPSHSSPSKRKACNDNNLEDRETTMGIDKVVERTLLCTSSVNINAYETPEDKAIKEELESVAYIYSMLRMAATVGLWGGSMDVINDIIYYLQDTDSLVFRCDYDYYRPDGTRFRSIDERVSFVNEDLEDIIDSLCDADGEPGFDTSADMRYRQYTLCGDAVRLFPYAAVFDSQERSLDVNLAVLQKYYPDDYEYVKEKLYEWNTNLHEQNGGMDNIKEREKMVDDGVFGKGTGAALKEMPPRFSRARGKKVRHAHRIRRRRLGELVGDGDGTLPFSPFPLLLEVDTGAGWMVWNNQAFFMPDANGKMRQLPRDANGHWKTDLGWMDGDELPEEAHDYAVLDMENGMFPDVSPLLAPLAALWSK